MFENGNYRRRKRRPKQMISNVQKPSSTSSSIPLDESSMSSSESNHNSLLISSNHDDDDLHSSSNNYNGYSFLKVDSTISPENKKRRRSPTPEPEQGNHMKKVKTVSAFSSIDALIAPSKEVKSVDQFSPPSFRHNHNQHVNNSQHASHISSLPPQYLSLLTNGFALNLPYNRAFSTK